MTGRPDEGHLSDEEISDLVDGEAGAGVERHLADCASCASRLDGWRSVSARIAAPPPVPADLRQEAVAAALAARPSGAARGRHIRALSGAAAAAAVLAAIGFGLSQVSVSNGAKTSSGAASVAAPGSHAAAGGTAVQGDLGDLASPAAVKAAVDRALSAPTSYGTAAPTGAASRAAPEGASGSASATAGPPSPCPDPARFLAGSSPRLLLSADAVYRSARARVYAYQVGAGRRALVVDARTCALLVDVPA